MDVCCTDQYLIISDNYYQIIILHAPFIRTTPTISVIAPEFSVSPALQLKCLLTQQFSGKYQLHNIIKRMSGQDVSVGERENIKEIYFS